MTYESPLILILCIVRAFDICSFCYFKMCNTPLLTVFTMFYGIGFQNLYSFCLIFYALWPSSPVSLASCLWHDIPSLPLCVLDFTDKWKHIVLAFQCLTYFDPQNVLNSICVTENRIFSPFQAAFSLCIYLSLDI